MTATSGMAQTVLGIELNDLLRKAGVDPSRTLVLRHRPTELAFRKALPLVIDETPELFNIYQSYQGPTLERTMLNLRNGCIASFAADGPGKATLVGLYRIGDSRPETYDEFWARPENIKLRELGSGGFSSTDGRGTIQAFDLEEMLPYREWRGKLVVDWPPPDRSWYRRAHTNVMPVAAIREDSVFAREIDSWVEMDFSWAEISLFRTRLRAALEQWPGIYAIWDSSDGKMYVGSASGGASILGRWLNYASSGDGGNKLLKGRDPSNFRFTILQRLSLDTPVEEVVDIERTWKKRLHTRAPYGLNEN